MPEAAERRNQYTCMACGGAYVTVNRDEGVTPMFLACRVTDGCGDRMVSSMYRVGPATPEPTFEWYRPPAKAIRRMKRRDPATADHVERGGLLLRPIEGDR